MTIFGKIVTGKDVESAMRSTIERWQADYLAEIAANNGRARGDLPAFRSFTTAFNLDKFDEDQTPACVVIAPGIIGSPMLLANGGYVATWGVGVGAVVSGQDPDNTYELAVMYSAAIRAMITQHKSLGGFSEDTHWAGERYDELTSTDVRTIAAGVVQFNVDVLNVVDPAQGPTTPSADATVPPGDWPTAQTVTVTTKKKV